MIPLRKKEVTTSVDSNNYTISDAINYSIELDDQQGKKKKKEHY